MKLLSMVNNFNSITSIKCLSISEGEQRERKGPFWDWNKFFTGGVACEFSLRSLIGY